MGDVIGRCPVLLSSVIRLFRIGRRGDTNLALTNAKCPLNIQHPTIETTKFLEVQNKNFASKFIDMDPVLRTLNWAQLSYWQVGDGIKGLIHPTSPSST